MTNLPAGWDTYDPNNHELSGDVVYDKARAEAASKAESRRALYGEALAALRRARSLTQVALARHMGVPQGEVSRIEHQADLLLSTFARYVNSMGGDLAVLVRFGPSDSIELDLALGELDEVALPDPSPAPDPAGVARLGMFFGRMPAKEAAFYVPAAALLRPAVQRRTRARRGAPPPGSARPGAYGIAGTRRKADLVRTRTSEPPPNDQRDE